MESWMTVYNWPVFRCPQLAGFEVSPEVQKSGVEARGSRVYSFRSNFRWAVAEGPAKQRF